MFYDYVKMIGLLEKEKKKIKITHHPEALQYVPPSRHLFIFFIDITYHGWWVYYCAKTRVDNLFLDPSITFERFLIQPYISVKNVEIT